MNATAAESPRETVLDALAAIMSLDRGDIGAADAMLSSYARCGDATAFVAAIAGIALCAVRYSAVALGQTPERLLAGVAAEVRGKEA